MGVKNKDISLREGVQVVGKSLSRRMVLSYWGVQWHACHLMMGVCGECNECTEGITVQMLQEAALPEAARVDR